MSKSLWAARGEWVLVLALVAVPAAAASSGSGAGEPLDERESYAFARTVEGSVSVAPEGQGVGEELQRNQPLLTGDRVWAGRDSRAELLLPDRNRLSVSSESSLRLEAMAYSGDRESRVTILRLEDGEILLEVSEEALGDELPRIESAAATIYVQEPGLYRVRTGGDGWLELVTREGYAEMVTDRGSTIVRAGEAAEAGAGRGGRIQISRAGSFSDLEQWSVDVAQGASRGGASERNLDASVDYAAADLDQNGSWVEVDSVSYWRPRVAVGWRPYWDGRWSWTPSGYTWVSYEPWGWVPYHYGRWSILPGYGWAWRPGAIYSPAWVYWHWSDGYAGWCPTGYYTDYYNPWFRGGYRWGSYGWAGGDWGYYSHWNFAPVNCFRNRNFRGHMRRGHDLRREHGSPEAPRGLITTDTRDFRPDRIDRTDQLLHRIRERERDSVGGELPDVTEFVGRKRDLPPQVARAIVPDGPREPRLRIDTPKVDDTPGWRRERDAPDQRAGDVTRDGAPRVDDGKGAPRPSGETGGEGKGVQRSGTRTGTRSAPEEPAVAGVTPASDTKGQSAVRSGEPRTSAPRTGAPAVGTDPRQGWKNAEPGSPALSSGRTGVSKGDSAGGTKGEPQVGSYPRSNAPVERVISGTRRALPRTDDGAIYGSKPPTGATGSTRSTPTSSSTRQKPIDATPPSRPRMEGGNSGSGGGHQGSVSTGGKSSDGYRGSTSGRPTASQPAVESRPRSSGSTPSTTRSPGGGAASAGSTPSRSQGTTGGSAPAASTRSDGSGGSRGSATSAGSRSGSSSGSSKSASPSRSGSKSSGSSSSGSSKSSGGGDKDD